MTFRSLGGVLTGVFLICKSVPLQPAFADNLNVSYEADSSSEPVSDRFRVLHLRSVNAKLHVAQSGAIWKLSLNGLGDITGAQKPDNLHIDRVFQSIGTNKDLKEAREKWFLHQAGVYHRHGRPNILFSPQLFHWYRPTSQTIDIVNLPQQAHDPRNAPNYAIFNHQKIQVINERTIRMSYRWTHQGPGSPQLDHFNFPWAVFSSDKVPHLGFLSSTGDGIVTPEQKKLESNDFETGFWREHTYSDAQLGDGSIAAVGFYSSRAANQGNGITLVFPHTAEQYATRVGHGVEGDPIMVLSRIPRGSVLRNGETLDSGDFYVIFGNRSEANRTIAQIAALESQSLKSAPQPYVFLLSAFDSLRKRTLFSSLPFWRMRGAELLQSNLRNFRLAGLSRSSTCPKAKRFMPLVKSWVPPKRRKSLLFYPPDRWRCYESPYGLLDMR